MMSNKLKMYILKAFKRDKTMEARESNKGKPIKGGEFFSDIRIKKIKLKSVA